MSQVNPAGSADTANPMNGLNSADAVNAANPADALKTDPASLPSLVLAYVGDAVFELFVRLYLLEERNGKVHELHDHATALVNAGAQARYYRMLEPVMTPQERSVARRGRNVNSRRVPKNAQMLDYRLSTGFEALIGFLFLSDQKKRLSELVRLSLTGVGEAAQIPTATGGFFDFFENHQF
jgi:ribonuclease-3 family protein